MAGHYSPWLLDALFDMYTPAGRQPINMRPKIVQRWKRIDTSIAPTLLLGVRGVPPTLDFCESMYKPPSMQWTMEWFACSVRPCRRRSWPRERSARSCGTRTSSLQYPWPLLEDQRLYERPRAARPVPAHAAAVACHERPQRLGRRARFGAAPGRRRCSGGGRATSGAENWRGRRAGALPLMDTATGQNVTQLK